MIDSETIVKSLKYHEATIEDAFVKCALRKAITLIDQQELAINNLKTELESRIKELEEQSKIVRCKDCKFYDGDGTCSTMGLAMIGEEWFCADAEHWLCADGERKDENAGPGKDD